jgi:hypothetical protein
MARGAGWPDPGKFFEDFFQGIHQASPQSIMPRVEKILKLFCGEINDENSGFGWAISVALSVASFFHPGEMIRVKWAFLHF